MIHWLNFIDTCVSWKVVDNNLSLAHVDRIFITVNFEEEQVEANDDTSFCRFEYIEAIVRLAKAKFLDQKVKICTTVSASLEKFIQEHIIPNRVEKMEWQDFRNKQLYVLDIDDLFKKNKTGIEALFKRGALKKNQMPR